MGLFFGISFGQSNWTKYGWQLYDNAGDARSIAMGNTSLGDKRIVSALRNPAIIGQSEIRKLTYGHQSRFAGIIQSDLLAYPLTTKNNRKFNIVVLHEFVGKIPNTQDLLLDWGIDGVPNTGDLGENNGYLDEGERLNNDDISFFNQHQFGIHVSTQFIFYGLDFGVAVKSLIHTLDNHIGTGVGLDIGMRKTFINKSIIGISVQNLIPGLVVWDSGNTEISKPQFQVGGSHLFERNNIPVKLLLLSDLIANISDQSLNDDFAIGSTGFNWQLGTEIVYKDRINIRLGRNQYGYYSTGLGITWTNLELNYAYQLNSNSTDLGSNHVISFNLNPHWLMNKF